MKLAAQRSVARFARCISLFCLIFPCVFRAIAFPGETFAQDSPVPAAVGHLLSVQGAVTVTRDKITVRVDKRYRLEIGDSISLAPTAGAQVLLYAAGVRYQLFGGTTVIVETDRLRVGTAEAKVISRLPTAARWMTPRTQQILGERLRGGSGSGLSATEPYGAVENSQVVLRWTNTLPVPRPAELIISVRRDGERDAFVTESVDAGATSFPLAVPATDAPEAVYFWEVTGQNGSTLYRTGGVFWLLTKTESEGLQSLEDSAKPLFLADPRGAMGHLVLARGYENLGLFRKALTEYRAAAQQSGPGSDDFHDEIAHLPTLLPP